MLTSSETASTPGRPRDEARELAILEATLVLLAEVGFDRLTMDAVAARAKASKATIYRRWAGKPELVLDAMRHYAADAPEDVDTGSLRGDLMVLVQEVRRKLTGFDGRLVLGLAQAGLSEPNLCQSLADQMGDEKNHLPKGIVDRAVARGELPEGADPSLFDEIAPSVTMMRLMVGMDLDDTFLSHLVEDLLIPCLRHPPSIPTARIFGCGPRSALSPQEGPDPQTTLTSQATPNPPRSQP